MDKFNLVILGFIAASFMLTLWWTFNTIRRIETQKNYCAIQLTSIAKLWRRANYVPENAKERESLYLYRDFLRKFDENEGQYPIMVKDGKVRCMTRTEYDNLVGLKKIAPVSVLMSLLSIVMAAGAIYVNFAITKTPWVGFALAAVIPVLQLILSFFVARFNRDKDNYREGIFKALKENSAAFLRITKPFIIVDAYPNKFGKNKKPLYATIGEISDEQVVETRDYIIAQKSAETKVVMNTVNNKKEINRMMKKTNKLTQPSQTVTLAREVPTATVSEPIPTSQPTVTPEPTTVLDALPRYETSAVEDLMDLALGDILPTQPKPEPKPEPNPEPKPEPKVEVKEESQPAEDDFSLEAIGQALEAEIAKRKAVGYR